MRLPIGYDNFGEIVEKKLEFIDKSLFIKEIIDDIATKVAVITRPRRFGKTLNLSMLQHFLSVEVDKRQTKEMFAGLKIAEVNHGEYLKYQGQYPVLFISFKDIKENSFASAVNKLRALIQEFYRAHQYLAESDNLTAREKELFAKFIDNKMNQEEAANAIYNLTELLYKHYNKAVYVLIDEYDTPIQAGYLNNYYQEIITFIRSLLGAALKTNRYLDKAVVTGILRVGKESIFSDLNNVTVYSVLQSNYSKHFGFTEEEVNELLKKAHLEARAEEIKNWYNGYKFGNTVVYNPWSIVNCIKEEGVLKPYWVNTSDNALIRDLLIKSDAEFKTQLEYLLANQPVEALISEHMVFADLKTNPAAIWSLLLMSGYLKFTSLRLNEDGMAVCGLAIPNREVLSLYRVIIKTWLSSGKGIAWYDNFLHNLLNGEIVQFEEKLNYILLHVISVYDMAQEPEAFYHGLMLGFIASIDKTQYELKSNRESGFGRYDLVIIPKMPGKLGIVMEFKSVVFTQEEKPDLAVIKNALTKEAEKALEQIKQKDYTAELAQRGVTDVIKIGLAFAGKVFRIKAERANK